MIDNNDDDHDDWWWLMMIGDESWWLMMIDNNDDDHDDDGGGHGCSYGNGNDIDCNSEYDGINTLNNDHAYWTHNVKKYELK